MKFEDLTPALDLRSAARQIWQAGVDAVSSDRLVSQVVQCDGRRLSVCSHEFSIADLERIVVLGAGKAGAGMAAAIEQALGEELVDAKVSGWVNVPADCVRPLIIPTHERGRPLRKIVLHAARPAGMNEPTEAGVFGTEKILDLARSLGPRDLGIVLISGGGSALLPAPIPEITLSDKQAITRWLMQSGASINELNAVRKRLSRIKGGGLARAAAGAKSLVTLIISDVIGDPLDVIASGPTVPDASTADEALAVLKRYHTEPSSVPDVSHVILGETPKSKLSSNVFNHVIGNNAIAVKAAKDRAIELGFGVATLSTNAAGEAKVLGQDLAEYCRCIRDRQTEMKRPICLLSGGEPIVKLVPTDQPRRGGRNQEVALAALQQLWDVGLDRIAILSGGTDGEDGPTDAAGAVVDEPLRQRARAAKLDPREFLTINNSYPFFEATGGLLLTGPTHTNVMDLRVAVIV